jgi:hypothetical protein
VTQDAPPTGPEGVPERPRKLPAKPWLHLGVVAMDRAPAAARRGRYGPAVEARSAADVESDVVACARSYRSGCLGMFLGLALLPLAPALSILWVDFLTYAYHRGVSGDVAEAAMNVGDVVLGVAWLAAYLLLAYVPAARGIAPYRRIAGAVAALEDMPAAGRAVWLAEYRAAPHPAGEVLEKRCRPFGRLVESGVPGPEPSA